MRVKQAKKLQIRISAEERAEWKAKASKSGMTMAQWVKEKCNGPEPERSFYRPKKKMPVKHLCSHCNGNGSISGGVVCSVCQGEGAISEVIPEVVL